jgi:AraC-like DNA-binding protein
MLLNINKPIIFVRGSHRHLQQNERHISRIYKHSVFLLVYDGILRFGEGEKQIEVRRGEYYIQRSGLRQNGDIPCDKTKYFFVHFDGEYTEDKGLPLRGVWDIVKTLDLFSLMEGTTDIGNTYLQKSLTFYSILNDLYNKSSPPEIPIAKKTMDIIKKEYRHNISIKEIANSLYIHENHLINTFKKEYGVTPYNYIITLRLEKAMELLKHTMRSEKDIAESIGFSDYFSFYKAFVKRFGYPPSDARK